VHLYLPHRPRFRHDRLLRPAACNDATWLASFKAQLGAWFKIKDLGNLSQLLGIEIEIEIVYNMYRMRRFYNKSRMRRLLSLGPPNYAIHGTYKSRLDR
jgi:hypothetical protein